MEDSTDQRNQLYIDTKDNATFAAAATIPDPYTLGPDSLPQDGVPQGTLTQYHHRSESIYPGVERDYWVYVPQQYDASQPASLMVFQDGSMYLAPNINVPTAFDNLIHAGQMPITIGVFANPGHKGDIDNRGLEYNSLGDQYARFLHEELLPEISAQYNISSDPADRAICGISSGAICAFTVAWERPDSFSKVVSHCGSFVDVRGGHNYPPMIRRTPPKPLRVFLQSGAQDFDVVYGNWPSANQAMATALAYRGYDYQYVFGEGGHNLNHGGAIFPDTLRWLWKGVRSQ